MRKHSLAVIVPCSAVKEIHCCQHSAEFEADITLLKSSSIVRPTGNNSNEKQAM